MLSKTNFGLKKIGGGIVLFLGILATALSKKGPERVATLSYREALRRLLSCRPDGHQAVKGAIVREHKADQYRILFLFLDSNGLPIESKPGMNHRQVVIADTLDDELLECFGEEDLLIFE